MVRTPIHRGALLLPLMLIGVLCTTIPVVAQDSGLERLVRKDGTSVVGVIVGFGQGAYRVRVGDATVEVSAQDVRTIEPARGASTPGERIREELPRNWVERIAEGLAVRPSVEVDAASKRLHADALAALLRGEWDFALRGATSVMNSVPGWADPKIVAIVVQSETGRESDALRLALRLSSEHPSDKLAAEVAAEAFRRGGFPYRAAELEEKVRIGEQGADGRRELARIWWSLDRERALEHWQHVLQADPRLDRARFPEAVLLRKAKAALALGDLTVAGQAIEELARDFPWTEAEVCKQRIALTEARLKQAELAGDLSLATLAAETLARLGEGTSADYAARLGRLREKGLTRALRKTDADQLQKWFREHAHLIEGTAKSDAAVAARMQELGLDALYKGSLTDARSGLALAQQLDPTAESPRVAAQVTALVERAIDELSRRHEERAFTILTLLHRYLPQRDALAVSRLVEFLERPMHEFLTEAERRGLAGRLAGVYGESGIALGSIPAPAPRTPDRRAPRVAPPIETADVESIARWFPVAVGTRWTYRLDDGTIEEREVIASRPDSDGGWLISIRVSPQGRVAYETRAWIRDGELVLGSPKAPPGEILVRGNLVIGDRWEWSRGNFHYVRSVEKAAHPVETPVGIFHEVRVLHAENALDSEEGGRTWSASHRVTFAEGVGVVRIEGASDAVDRELIEFRPGAGAAVDGDPVLGRRSARD